MVKNYNIETSLTTDYRKSAWGIERIVLDSISNHLPADSNGTITTVKIKQDGEWYDLKTANLAKPTEEVVFEDNGTGYDAGLLSVLFSSKSADVLSVGQFGEGLKLVSAAAMRHGINLEYRSRNWSATPYTKPENIDGNKINRLCFKIKENGDHLNGSRTVFTNPSKELMDKIFQLPKKVLALNDSYKEIYNKKDGKGTLNFLLENFLASSKSYNSRIIDLGTSDTDLFIKGVRVQGLTSIFSYDLSLENISPDRVFANRECVLDTIEYLLKGCSSTEVIERVLSEAVKSPEHCYDEFTAFANRKVDKEMTTGFNEFIYYPSSKKILCLETSEKFKEIYKLPDNLWAVSFKKLFGDNAIVASSNLLVNQDAELMGYIPVKLNNPVGDYLRTVGVKSANEVSSEHEYKWASLSDLTESETRTLGKVQEINQVILGHELPVDVRVYFGLFTKSGREIKSSYGARFTEKDGTKYIGIKRSRVDNLGEFVNTYIHELGHLVTGASDSSREFTDFFVDALSKVAIHYMNQEKS